MANILHSLKLVYGKSQPVIVGKLFDIVWELAQGLRDCAIAEKIQTGEEVRI